MIQGCHAPLFSADTQLPIKQHIIDDEHKSKWIGVLAGVGIGFTVLVVFGLFAQKKRSGKTVPPTPVTPGPQTMFALLKQSRSTGTSSKEHSEVDDYNLEDSPLQFPTNSNLSFGLLGGASSAPIRKSVSSPQLTAPLFVGEENALNSKSNSEGSSDDSLGLGPLRNRGLQTPAFKKCDLDQSFDTSSSSDESDGLILSVDSFEKSQEGSDPDFDAFMESKLKQMQGSPSSEKDPLELKGDSFQQFHDDDNEEPPKTLQLLDQDELPEEII